MERKGGGGDDGLNKSTDWLEWNFTKFCEKENRSLVVDDDDYYKLDVGIWIDTFFNYRFYLYVSFEEMNIGKNANNRYI